jgi:putative aldouronate transport system substrate-binding protein
MKRVTVFILVLAVCGVIAFAEGASEKRPAAATGAAKPAMDTITYGTWIYYQNPDSEAAFEALFKKNTGVTLDVVSFAKASWEDKVRALYMSGDAPDVTLVPTNFTSLARQGMLAPLDAYIEKHPGFNALKAQLPQVFRGGTYEGKSYGLAASTGAYMNFWMRQDVLDKLGLKMPGSMDALVAALEAFKKVEGPNGQKVIPMTMANSVWPHDVFTTYFGAGCNEIVLRNGTYQDNYLSPQFKEYLDFMRSLYVRELLDKEVPTLGYGDVRKKCQTGVALSCIMWDDTADAFIKGMSDNKIEGGLMVPVPPFKGKNGVFGLSYSPPTVDYGVNAKAENPEFVFNTFMNWLFLEDGGIIATSRGVEGFDFTVENGTMTLTKLPNSGVGNHGQKCPPVKPGYAYPFKFDPVSQAEYDNIVLVARYAKPFFKDTDKIYPSKDASEYWAVESDLYDKKVAMVSKYIIGEVDYPAFVAEYTRYINEIKLPELLAALNRK